MEAQVPSTKTEFAYFEARKRIIGEFFKETVEDIKSNRLISIIFGIAVFVLILVVTLRSDTYDLGGVLLVAIVCAIFSFGVGILTFFIGILFSGITQPLLPSPVTIKIEEKCADFLSQFDPEAQSTIGSIAKQHRDGSNSSNTFANAIWGILVLLLGTYFQGKLPFNELVIATVLILLLIQILSYFLKSLYAQADLVIEIAINQIKLRSFDAVLEADKSSDTSLEDKKPT